VAGRRIDFAEGRQKSAAITDRRDRLSAGTVLSESS
jgi:hypothetical protein